MSAQCDEYKRIDQLDHEKAIEYLLAQCREFDGASEQDYALEFLRLYAAKAPLVADQKYLMRDVMSVLMEDFETETDCFLEEYPDAIPLIREYCHLRDDPCLYAEVGGLFLRGFVVPRDEAIAFELFSAGANLSTEDNLHGSASAIRAQMAWNDAICDNVFRVVDALRAGRGTEKDVVKAFFLYADYYPCNENFFDGEEPFDADTLFAYAREALEITRKEGDLARSYEIVKTVDDLNDYYGLSYEYDDDDEGDDEDRDEEVPPESSMPLGKEFITLYKELIDLADRSPDGSVKESAWYRDCLSRVEGK